jgi:hypothetical protein
VEEGGGSGARVSGCCAEELKRRIEWSRAGEAREQEIRGPEGGCSARATAAARCRPGGVRIGVARAGKGQQGSGKRRKGVVATRGGEGKQEVVPQQLHSGGRGVYCTSGRGGRGAAGARGRRREGGGPRGLCAIFR